MYLKGIVCTVQETNREPFSKAQEAWSALRGVDGFCGQFGGWDVQDPTRACIVGLWRDEAAYRHFMEEVHDRIFFGNDQGRTYETISVTLEACGVDLPAVEHLVQDALAKGEVFRLAECLPTFSQADETVQLVPEWLVPRT
ncbi:MAG TPA: YdbC family protein [Bacilli bacterium]|nr:YdbC family protein [Bacilli bacterium]